MKALFHSIITVALIFFSVICTSQNKLNKAIANPAGVTKLRIEYSTFGKLPSEIRTLTDLKTLYLFSNGLDSFPETIGNLQNPETLVVSSNSLKTLPSLIGR